MKKLLTLMFTALMAISLALPVLAQDAGAGSQDQGAAGQDQGAKPKKEKKAKKAKKKKSDQKMDQGGEAPKQ
jgi:hypothetical protein